MSRTSFVWLLASLACACGPGAVGGGHADMMSDNTFAARCSGKSTQLTGTALAPNGTDPVAAAHVYVVTQTQPMPMGVACDTCAHPVDDALVETEATPDGHFQLSLDRLPAGGEVELVVAKGRFRRATSVPVAACTSSTVPAAALTLPGRAADGDLPKIAVAYGPKDHLEVVLDALGVHEFDCYNGGKSSKLTVASPCPATSPDVETLLTDAQQLATYDVLFLSCAPGKYAALTDPSTVDTNLAAWVAAGGRLFVTDQSYDYVEQALPAYIEFLPGQKDQTTPEPVDAANLGVGGSATSGGTSYSGTVADPALATWLDAVGALTPDTSSLPLDGFLNPWSAQKRVAPGVRTLVTAVADYYTSSDTTLGAPSMSTEMPITVEFDHQMCGRVLYSSYHTRPSTGLGTALSAQEKMLEYLMLDVGGCVGP